MNTREHLGGAYAPPRTHKMIRRTRILIGALCIVLAAAVTAAVLLLRDPPPPDRSGDGATALQRLMTAPVITAAGTVRTKDGVQHPFTVDINTDTGDALGTWASAAGTDVTYTVSRRALFVRVNPGAWTSLGLASSFQGWALTPERLLGETPVVFEPAAMVADVAAGPSSHVGNEYTYPGGTIIRLRDGEVESVTFKGTDYTLSVDDSDTAVKKIADIAREAAAARVATVNDTQSGFTVTVPAEAVEQPQGPPSDEEPAPSTAAEPAP